MMIRFIFCSLFMITGLMVLTTSLIGNFRFGFILNRMQVSAISDTLGALLIVTGLIIASGFTLTSLKLVLMIIFLWFINPVASHFLAKTEVIVNENIANECEVIHNDDI